VSEALASVRRIDGPGAQSPPHRVLGRLSSQFDYADPAEIAGAAARFGAELDELFESLDTALARTYFRPSRIEERTAQPIFPREQGQQ
jgi:hypothetical protein